MRAARWECWKLEVAGLGRYRMPLCPLNTVLFPQMVLPLHIFEPRYRLMIQECLDQEIEFGVALIESGVEVGGPAQPHQIGTAARIDQASRLEDGRMHIATVGTNRFRVIETYTDRPYLTGLVEVLPEVEGNAERCQELSGRVRQLFGDYWRLVRMLSNRPIGAGDLDLPEDPKDLSYFVASALAIGKVEKQAMLEAASVEERLQMQVRLIRRECEVLRLLAAGGRNGDG